jgi:hypothetical protein
MVNRWLRVRRGSIGTRYVNFAEEIEVGSNATMVEAQHGPGTI